MGGSSFCVDIGENFEERIAVPGFPFEGAADLIGEANGFGHGGSFF
jgi:hypothetical protein